MRLWVLTCPTCQVVQCGYQTRKYLKKLWKLSLNYFGKFRVSKNNLWARGHRRGFYTRPAEIVGQFNDYAFENPGKTFEEVVLKKIRAGLVSGNATGEGYSRRKCRKVFDRERES
jgi:hypothetical protein